MSNKKKHTQHQQEINQQKKKTVNIEERKNGKGNKQLTHTLVHTLVLPMPVVARLFRLHLKNYIHTSKILSFMRSPISVRLSSPVRSMFRSIALPFTHSLRATLFYSCPLFLSLPLSLFLCICLSFSLRVSYGVAHSPFPSFKCRCSLRRVCVAVLLLLNYWFPFI